MITGKITAVTDTVSAVTEIAFKSAYFFSRGEESTSPSNRCLYSLCELKMTLEQTALASD